ncbi:unnamed protein product [Blepharisma stoltei]|uniref:Tudor domain-containing protein n=1 Tax=Blepharisma stoltei TaxID=1481888 RepID=A0AAU9JRU5_9CILI|nr:unnamed protein product [Blepharisma stoltei]
MESTNFVTIQAKIDEYKDNLARVEEALKRNADKVRDEEARTQRERDLTKLKNDLEKAIEYNQDLLKIAENRVQEFFSSVRLTVANENHKCNAYYEQDKNWHPAHINKVNEEEQTAEIIFLGFADKYKLPASYIQMLVPPKQPDLHEGQEVEVLLQDGKWYPANIQIFNEQAVTVKLSRWGHMHELSYDCVRFCTNPQKRPLPEREIFEIPNSLKILPNDNEHVRLKKKKKIKALKKAWRQNQIEKETRDYTSSWKNFQQKAQKKSNESMFRTPEGIDSKVGISTSGKAMTKNPERIKYKDYFEQFTKKDEEI